MNTLLDHIVRSCFVWFSVLLFGILTVYGNDKPDDADGLITHPELAGIPKTPVAMDVKIQVNKIYGINTVDETYSVDGYFVASWYNDAFDKAAQDIRIYENNNADEIIGKLIWIPAFEFINVIGNRNVSNKQIIIHPNGKITYNERFNAVFTTEMNFRKFPFDSQKFVVQLEGFSYDTNTLFFSEVTPELYYTQGEITEEWKITDKKAFISAHKYSHLNEKDPISFSRYNIEITATRSVVYYFWQFIFPLFLIISISWSVFWIKSMSDQLATSFTLMLTLVAFNFNASSILPNLPYRTFIESLITLGYLSIFINLVMIVIGNSILKKKSKASYKNLMRYCRYIFPIAFFVLTILQAIAFLY
ncbi:gamma-aminobutyric-acid receptor subunit beta [Aquimarina sp. TRL1]|uniref:gamma-aminobutyric-acid receptor subunit beta n=1 Tax=Aquimarina sp. (strain TRL1) TaxID=2736252 RepID=UPI00158DED21|nr:gamma-aminobutyric-acid receptor subunit beta [Aquimarina sp. TRL1]QKX06934.1 gamma-aminobutyric-acid receptor subunit beta [Aquimarina sp. TRL1]